MSKVIRIGTRESQLAIWQANEVKTQLETHGVDARLVYIKTEGDLDLTTPLYEMGVQGIFTRTLDIALLDGRIDIAVHSMKDVPTQLPKGIVQGAVLKRGPVYDLLVSKSDTAFLDHPERTAHIATSSIRRKAQWLNKYPKDQVHPLRGNINTRLQKLDAGTWDGAIFAQAGLERINLRPKKSMVLNWMLPAPAQGAIVVLCREEDEYAFEGCRNFSNADAEICTQAERDFLRELLGGCSTPISALAEILDRKLYFRGNILAIDGSFKVEIEKVVELNEREDLGKNAARELLLKGGNKIALAIKHQSIRSL